MVSFEKPATRFWAFFFQGKSWAWYYETLDLRKLQHTPGPHPRSSTTCLRFGNPFIFALLGILGLCSRGLEWDFLRIKTPNRIFLVLCLEDHNPVRITPIYFSHGVPPIWKGNVALLRGLANHLMNHPLGDDPPSGVVSIPSLNSTMT